MIKGKIDSIAFGGEGVLRHEGYVVFVPFTAPEDEVEIKILSKKKNFAHGELTQLITSSPLRTTPRCPHFGTCGGCQLQHLNDSAQIEAKRRFVLDALTRIGKLPWSDFSIIPAQKRWDYRHHIRLNLRKEKEGFKAGYIGYNSSEFVTVQQCPIFLPPENPLFDSLHTLLSSLSNQGIEKAFLRLIKVNQGKFLLAFNFFPHLPQNHVTVKKALEDNDHWNGVLMSSPTQTIQWGDTYCEIELCGLKVQFSPFGFLQNHPQQCENLYRLILQELPQKKGKVLDLYCGIGLTSMLFTSQGWQSLGVESHKDTITLAKENAHKNGSPAQFYDGKAEILGVSLLKKEHPEVVLCNPPRAGLDPLLIQALIEVKPSHLFYISCMPSTLARDLQKLVSGGYRISKMVGFDMFPQTTHVETFVHLIKEV